MYILEIEDIKKSYLGKTVLNIKSTNIEKNKITALIGPSGAGKSTLLSIINGIEKPDFGKIIFDSDDITKQFSNLKMRKMSFVFQNPIMFNKTVFENIAYGLKVRKQKKSIILEQVNEIAEWTGLKEILKQKAITLSGGEAGRVSFARAMIINPDLLLMDEPTANLDPQNVAVIEELIYKSNKNFGTSILLVTHNMFQAKRLADNVKLLIGGEIIEEGRTNQIFENPKNEQTINFVSGKMIY